MVQRRAETGAPDHDVDALLPAVSPHHAVRREAIERSHAAEHAALTRLAHGRHHHDVSETRGLRLGAALLPGSVPRGRLVEQVAAVHVIGQEARLLERDPGRVRYA